MPLYADSVLDEVKNSVNIVSLISSFGVELRKRGRDYKACCPFHHEKTPSFTVSEEKQMFYCFGCHEGGDVFKFIMKIETMSFQEAVQFLAERHGIALPAPADSGQNAPASNKNDLNRLMMEAVSAYQQTLLTTAEGKPALQYLQGRGVVLDTIAKFQLGFSPSGGNFLVSLLHKKGFSIEAMEECGLCRRAKEGNMTYDYFRGRIMFPITDVQGRPVAFGARAMDERPPKYLNSPETRLYNKGRNLFGLSHSRDAIRKRGNAVLVEGYMDCIVPFQHGVDNVVASCGTALTPPQVELLGRYTRDVVVSYDADVAGQSAAQKSLELFLEGDFRVRVLNLPEGKDPDEYIRKAGADEYRRREREALPYLEFVLEKAIRDLGGQENMVEPKAKVQTMNSVLPYLARVPNAVERSEYVSIFARRLGIEDRLLLAEMRKAAQEKRTRLPEVTQSASVSCKAAEELFLRFLLENTELQGLMLPLVSEEDFAGLASEKIFSIILDEFRSGRTSSFESLRRQFSGDQEQAFLAQLELKNFPEESSLQAAKSCLCTLRKERLTALGERIKRELAALGEGGDNEAQNHLLKERMRVNRELRELDGNR